MLVKVSRERIALKNCACSSVVALQFITDMVVPSDVRV